MGRYAFRKDVSLPGMLAIVRDCFESIPDPKPNCQISMADHLMSGMALFGLKFPSLLQFDQQRSEEVVRHNLKMLYGIKHAPSDTYLRERLDEVDAKHLSGAYKKLFSVLQRNKGLEDYTVFGDSYLLSIDGTGQYSSNHIHCQNCCQRQHRNGEITYYHQLMGAAIVHPMHKIVFPVMPEPITQQDGSNKNDSERHAGHRLLSHVRRTHPHLKLIVLADGLWSNAPPIKQMQSLNMRYLLVAKPKDHKLLFSWLDASSKTQIYEERDDQCIHHRFRYHTDVPLNDANFDLLVNVVEYWEENRRGQIKHFAWVTDLEVSDTRVMDLMRAGRSRWRIENETFNTLKNGGYAFEHNFGHGHKHLATVLMHLMMLSFLVDQIQQRCCGIFNQVLHKQQRLLYVWQKQRGLFSEWLLDSWEVMYRAMIEPVSPVKPTFDSS